MKKILLFATAGAVAAMLSAQADDVVKVGSTYYPSIAAAIDATSAGDRATLQVDTDENVEIPAGKTLYFDEGDYRFTGTFTGAGTVNMSGKPSKITSGSGALLDDNWTGVFQVQWTGNGLRFVFDDFGNANSTVELVSNFTGLPSSAWSGGRSPSISPKVRVTGNWTISDGWAEGADNKNATVFSSLSGTGNVTLNGAGSAASAATAATVYYQFNKIEGYTGTLGGRRAGYIFKDFVTSTTPALGDRFVKLTSEVRNADLSGATVNGSAIPLTDCVVGGQRGVYYVSAVFGGVGYASLQDAIDAAAASSADDKTVSMRADSSDAIVIPSGVTVACGDFAFTGTLGGSGRIEFLSPPAQSAVSFTLSGSDKWTGTFVVGWQGGRNTCFALNEYGISGSTVEVRNLAGGYVCRANANITVLPYVSVPEGCSMTLDNGYSGKKTEFTRITGGGTVTFSGYTCNVNQLFYFSGTLVTCNGSSNYGTVADSGTTIGDIVVSIPEIAAGNCIVKTAAGTKINSLSATKLLGVNQAALNPPMALEYVDGGSQPGIYVKAQPHVKYGDGYIAPLVESGNVYTATVRDGTALSTIQVIGEYGEDLSAGFAVTLDGTTATIELKPVEYNSAPKPVSGETITLDVNLVPGLYYAAASAASIEQGDDSFVRPAYIRASAETVLTVPNPGPSQGFVKVWVSVTGD